jgi:thioredoxin reductase (NADPH)
VPEIVDALVVGGGPAGLSAALNLARHDRTVSMFDAGGGRSSHGQITRNYLGFPSGVAAVELPRLGRQQLAGYEQVRCFDERVAAISRSDGAFVATLAGGEQRGGRTIVPCTGVEDRFLQEAEPFIGRGAFWCITCDGYETRGKDVVVIGHSDAAAVQAMQVGRLTSSVAMLTNHDRVGIGEEMRSRLDRAAIEIVDDRVASLVGAPGRVEGVRTASGRELAAQAVFIVQAAAAANQLLYPEELREA